jgi:hypothetical protein
VEERGLAGSVEDDVVGLAVLGEVFVDVVDHLVGAERTHQVDVLRVAHGRYVRTELLRDLNAADADRPGGAEDDDALPAVDVSLPEAGHRAQRTVGDSRGLGEAQTRRHVRDHAVLAHAHVLRIRTGADTKTRSPGSNSMTPRRLTRRRRQNSVPITRLAGFGLKIPVKTRLMKYSALRRPQSLRVAVVA